MPGSIIGGIFGNKAASAQADAAEDAGDIQLKMFDKSVELSEPWRTAGEGALSALNFELGLGPSPTLGESTSFNVGDRTFDTRKLADKFINSERDRFIDANRPRPQIEINERDGGFNILEPTGPVGETIFPSGSDPFDLSVEEITEGGQPYAGFQETPGYQFQLDEGQKAINRSLAARGRLLSGPAVKEGMRFSQGLADQTYSNHLTRLANLSGLGSGVAQQTGAFGVQTGQGVANSMIQGGNARASGFAATGQAISGGVNFLGGLAGAISDRRLKTDILRIGKSREGYPTYGFRYIWDAPGTVHIGVMADEVPPEITYDVGDFKAVDYSMVTL